MASRSIPRAGYASAGCRRGSALLRSLHPLRWPGLLGCLVALLCGFSAAAGADDAAALPWDEVRLFTEVLEQVKGSYVDPVDDGQLFSAAIRGMLDRLDPYSRFLSAEEYANLRISSGGQYSGVGLEVSTADGRLQVISPIEGTPAEQAGLQSGDIILRIDAIEIDKDNILEAVAKLRGKSGTKVQLSVSREGLAEPLSFELVRRDVQMHSVRARLLEPGIGYLRIIRFSSTTAAELRDELAALDEGLSGLVLDLRNNPGGVLKAAVEVSDGFLDSGVIVMATGRGHDANFRHEARPGDLFGQRPMIVMVNGGTASAAEIVAAALRDNDRATLVGGPTFGKGSVQSVIRLSSGEAIKLTTSRYFRPSGEIIHGKGIVPDVILENPGVPASAGGADHAMDEALEVLRQLLQPVAEARLH